MTPEEIDAMPAGKQMDLLVHEHVFLAASHYTAPPWSTSDAAALTVLKKIGAESSYGSFWIEAPQGAETTWGCGKLNADSELFPPQSARAPTLALAVCRAALKAVLRPR